MAKIVRSTSVITAWNSLWDFCDLTQSERTSPEAFSGVGVGDGRPIEYQWIRNWTGVMVRKPPYSFKRLLNVYKVRLSVYKIKR